MNLDRLLPKTSFGRFFLINVISLALFWLLIQPIATTGAIRPCSA